MACNGVQAANTSSTSQHAACAQLSRAYQCTSANYPSPAVSSKKLLADQLDISENKKLFRSPLCLTAPCLRQFPRPLPRARPMPPPLAPPPPPPNPSPYPPPPSTTP